MKRFLIVTVAVMMPLAGCVSPESQRQLTILQNQCAAGNQDACTAAAYQAQANQVEQTNNANVALGAAAIIVGAGLGAAAISNGPYYGGGYYRGGYRGWHR